MTRRISGCRRNCDLTYRVGIRETGQAENRTKLNSAQGPLKLLIATGFNNSELACLRRLFWSHALLALESRGIDTSSAFHGQWKGCHVTTDCGI